MTDQSRIENFIEALCRLQSSLNDMEIKVTGIQFSKPEDMSSFEHEISNEYLHLYDTDHATGERTFRGLSLLINGKRRVPSFREFHEKRTGSFPGPRGCRYDDIFSSLCESFVEYVALAEKDFKS